MRTFVHRLLAIAILAGGVASATPAWADDPVDDAAPLVAPVRDPVDYGRDYGRLLILLSVPAAFLGLHLHLSRRAQIIPPTP